MIHHKKSFMKSIERVYWPNHLQKNSKSYSQGQKNTAILIFCPGSRNPVCRLNLKISSSVILPASSQFNFHVSCCLEIFFKSSFCKYLQRTEDMMKEEKQEIPYFSYRSILSILFSIRVKARKC